MILHRSFLILIAIINFSFVFSQNQKMEDSITKTLALGKNTIIQKGYEIIINQNPSWHFQPDDFKITVWANTKKVIVTYERFIKYIPMNKEQNDFCYDLSVDILAKEVTPTGGVTSVFYIPTPQHLKNIEFLKTVFGLPHPGFENFVFEQKDMYRIEKRNEVAFGTYFIDKITGKDKMSPIQGSYAASPKIPDLIPDNDPLIQVKE